MRRFTVPAAHGIAAGTLAVLLAAGGLQAQGTPLPASRVAVRDGEGWRTFWSAENAPAAWEPRTATLLSFPRWHADAGGLSHAELALAGSGEAWRTRLILVRIDARSVRLTLDTATRRLPLAGAWSIDRAPGDAIFAVNAGVFRNALPWGWVVMNRRQWLPPERAPLAATIAQDPDGTLRWLYDAATDSAAASGQVEWAFQSYPVLLRDGAIPAPLRSATPLLDVAHRDARAAICRTTGDTLLVALTRFDALGKSLGAAPFGLTLPEMAGIMGALGCRDAVALDGGISAQMMVRNERGGEWRWPALRAVPLALVARPK